MSVAIGASAAGARAYTATASQGLLFMMEARLQRRRARAAHRHDAGQPGRRRAHQHLERPQRRHGRARRRLGPALRRDQPGGRGPAHPGLPPRRGAVGPRHGVHGRVHPHPRHRTGGHARPGRRWTPSCPPYEPRQVLDPDDPVLHRRHGRARGVRGGALPGARPPAAGARTASASWARSSPRPSGATRAGSSTRTGAPTPRWSSSPWARSSGTIKDVVDAQRDAGLRIGALGITSFRPFPIDAVRDALAGARRSSWSRRPSASASAACSRPTWPWRSAGCPARGHGGRRPRRPRRSPRRRCEASSRRPPGASCERLTFLDLNDELVERELERIAQHRRVRALRPRTCCATSAPSPRGSAEPWPVRFYQVGSFAVGNRLVSRADRTVQSDAERVQLARLRATGPARAAARPSAPATPSMRPCGPPAASWWPSTPPAASRCSPRPTPRRRGRSRGCTRLFGNAPAVATGVAAALRVKGRTDDEGDRPGRRRRHGRHRLRVPLGHVRAQRRRPVHLLRQRGLHEHRRAAVRGDPAGGAHGDDRGGRPRSGERLRPGQEPAPSWPWRTASPTWRRRRWPTCTTSRTRSTRAMEIRGARYIHILVPCPLGWGSRPERHGAGRPPGHPDGPLPRLRGGARRGRPRVRPIRRPAPVDGVPAPPGPLRPPLRRGREPGAARHRRRAPGDGRPQHRRYGLLEDVRRRCRP